MFLFILLGSVAFAAVIGIGAILIGDFGSFEIRVLLTTLTITATSILGLACGAYLESGRARSLPLFGIAASIITAIMTFFIIWEVTDESETYVKITVSFMLFAVSISHLSLLSLARLDQRFLWASTAAHVSVWTLTAIILFLVWFEPDIEAGVVSRIIGILAILIASISIATPIFHKLSHSDRTIEQIDIEIQELEAKIEQLRQEKISMESND